MSAQLNHTHDPAARSWVELANRNGGDFPIQNLPFCVFREQNTDEPFRGGVAIGDQVIDLTRLRDTNCLQDLAKEAARAGSHANLNPLMALGPAAWSALRHGLFDGLKQGASAEVRDQINTCLVPQTSVEYAVPAQIGDYTDFYTSVHHATNIGKQFRTDNPLLPNYKWVPIGYHGRASSIGVSGQTFARPKGQTKAPNADAPVLAPSQRLDIELELGVFIGQGNEPGQSVDINEAESHVFGICLLNDWSARDIQSWEYQPLGPFLSKNFATTISPWVVTLEALAPYRVPLTRAEGDPMPLPYLDSASNRTSGAFDIQLQVGLQTERMRAAGEAGVQICQTSYRHAYWTVAQMVTHHAINGCNLQTGDLLGTGTLSGPSLDQAGALIELTEGGKNPVNLPHGETRTYLEDGDAVVIRGWCVKEGAARIGFGECWGTVLPALS